MTTTYTAEEIRQMRDWVMDCAGTTFDEEIIEDMTDEQIIRYVRRNYDGGIAQFQQDCLPLN